MRKGKATSPMTMKLLKLTKQEFEARKKLPKKFGLPPILISEKDLIEEEDEEEDEFSKKSGKIKLKKGKERKISRADMLHWKQQLLNKYRTPEEIAALQLLRPENDPARTEVGDKSEHTNSLYAESVIDEEKQQKMNELDAIKLRIRQGRQAKRVDSAN
jgi:hypothetical protein